MKRYEFIDHTADIGLRIFGNDLPALFQNAGFALFDVIADISKVMPVEKRTYHLQRDTLEELLVEWLSALLYTFDTEQILFRNFSVITLDHTSLVAEAEGEPMNTNIHSIETEVKAVTYHNLNVSQDSGNWIATVVFDV
jgi:SHS2 domain-containing protein